MHPLTLIAVGLYGKTLPNQNGAPLRLVVPWKYGFKSIKSIVRIHLQEQQPVTSWQTLAPREYGFYANVNPAVDHPRWSQATERRLPSTLFRPNRIPTQMFNGYAEQAAHLYRGMDLARDYLAWGGCQELGYLVCASCLFFGWFSLPFRINWVLIPLRL